MYSLKLLARNCISCGICMDVCETKAIAMHTTWPKSPEGRGAYLPPPSVPDQQELSPVPMMTFYIWPARNSAMVVRCAWINAPVNSLVLELNNSASHQKS